MEDCIKQRLCLKNEGKHKRNCVDKFTFNLWLGWLAPVHAFTEDVCWLERLDRSQELWLEEGQLNRLLWRKTEFWSDTLTVMIGMFNWWAWLGRCLNRCQGRGLECCGDVGWLNRLLWCDSECCSVMLYVLIGVFKEWDTLDGWHNRGQVQWFECFSDVLGERFCHKSSSFRRSWGFFCWWVQDELTCCLLNELVADWMHPASFWS